MTRSGAYGRRSIWITALILLAAGRVCSAQTSIFEEQRRLFVDTEQLSHACATADLDLDGDLDIVFGSVSSGASCSAYLNRGGRFPTTRDWQPTFGGLGPTVYDVALGDLNGDGFPDLVCGTDGAAPVYVYFNTGGLFGTAPGWESKPRSSTRSVALGDYDGDGFLDLACGNTDGPDLVFRGTASGLQTEPSWTSGTDHYTKSVAWGDVDGDGDLDLVCGHWYSSDAVFLNSGSELDTIPAWAAQDAFATNTVALGDLNGDNRLDLVCGTDEFEPLVVYLNSDTLFAAEPSWTLVSQEETRDVELADLDGDNDLDLVATAYYAWNEIYLNTPDGLEGVQPERIGDEAGPTTCLATPDLDGDGRPDLVFGSDSDNTYHLNRSFPFVSDPFWQAETSLQTLSFSAAFGRVNQDEYPDLVLAIAEAGDGDVRNRVYLNQGGYFLDAPSWSTPEAEYTRSVFLCDMDGDGNADLISGNYGTANSLYLNTGSGFADTTAWQSGPSLDTYAVVAGDIDGNGWNDIVCANLQHNELYLNFGGTLEEEPTWTSDDEADTRCLALLDLDGDGDLDLICGNTSAVNQVYLNENGTYGTSPDWWTNESSETWCLATGDVNADGFVDVVFGNRNEANGIYLGLGDGDFVRSTDELTQPRETIATALLDVDADGDLDLLFADKSESGQPVSIYRNDGGGFSEDNVLASVDVYSPGGIATGDMDLDGDADLVLPLEYAAPVLLRGRFGSDRLGPPDPLLVQLPNHPPALHDVSVVEEPEQGRNRYRVTLSATDPESDDVWIVPEYQLAGDPEWIRPDLSIAKALGPLATSPDGLDHVLEWYVWDAPIDDRDVIVRLRTVPYPLSDARIDRIPAYLVNAGPLDVFRPEITVTASRLDFVTVTVGDTVQVPLRIENTGSDVLIIDADEFALPSQMRPDPQPPYSIPARTPLDLTIYLEPSVKQIEGDTCSIASNDTLTGEVALPVTTHVLDLTDGIITQLLSPQAEVPLGDALTVICTPGNEVDVDGGHLVYRAGGSEAFVDSVALQKQTSEEEGGYYFYATIPGEHVTENGLEYFLRIHNSDVFRTDPAGAPDQYIGQAVAAASELTTYATHTSGSDYLQGRSIPVTAERKTGYVYEAGTLFYRRGGDVAYESLALDLEGEGGLTAAIPDSLVGPRGLEYYIEVRTARAELSDPPLEPALRPHVLPIKVTNLVEPRRIRARTYRMVSVPLSYGDDSEETMLTILGEQFGDYDQAVWRCFRYDPVENRYREANGSDDAFSPAPGRAYWLISAEAGSMSTGTAPGFSPDTSAPREIELVAGRWNQVGHPFGFPVAWNDLTVNGEPVAQAEFDGEVQVAVWDPTSGDYIDSAPAVLEPFRGCFILNTGSADAVLAVPPVAVDPDTIPDPQPKRRSTPGAADDEAAGWSLALTARCGDHADRGVTAGVHPGAAADLDRLDRARPPASPQPGLRVYFPSCERYRHLGPFGADFRPVARVGADPARGGWTWHLEVSKDFDDEGVMDEIVLEAAGIESIPAGYRVLLVDRIAQRTSDLREVATYSYRQGRRGPVTGEEEARFRLLVGTADYVEAAREFGDLPGRTALGRNRPNPFNPATLIRFDLDRPARIRLCIYDVRGLLVRTLLDETVAAGRHEAPWDGLDRSGSPVASGVYFSRLTTDRGFQATRKMSLVR